VREEDLEGQLAGGAVVGDTQLTGRSSEAVGGPVVLREQVDDLHEDGADGVGAAGSELDGDDRVILEHQVCRGHQLEVPVLAGGVVGAGRTSQQIERDLALIEVEAVDARHHDGLDGRLGLGLGQHLVSSTGDVYDGPFGAKHALPTRKSRTECCAR
jgi:hypothetical protein